MPHWTPARHATPSSERVDGVVAGGVTGGGRGLVAVIRESMCCDTDVMDHRHRRYFVVFFSTTPSRVTSLDESRDERCIRLENDLAKTEVKGQKFHFSVSFHKNELV